MDWDTFTSETKKLGKKIDFKPDCIISIARGGIVPAVILSAQMDIKDMYVLKVHREGGKRKIIAEVFADISNKKVLLVDDMMESGKTMSAVKEYLESKKAEVKTACIYIMPHSQPKPEFYLDKVSEVKHFPWE